MSACFDHDQFVKCNRSRVLKNNGGKENSPQINRRVARLLETRD